MFFMFMRKAEENTIKVLRKKTNPRTGQIIEIYEKGMENNRNIKKQERTTNGKKKHVEQQTKKHTEEQPKRTNDGKKKTKYNLRKNTGKKQKRKRKREKKTERKRKKIDPKKTADRPTIRITEWT